MGGGELKKESFYSIKAMRGKGTYYQWVNMLSCHAVQVLTLIISHDKTVKTITCTKMKNLLFLICEPVAGCWGLVLTVYMSASVLELDRVGS